jgi:type IV pilus assembly protein PilM
MAVTKKNQLIGLDIGSYCIKLVEIEDSKKGRTLRNFGSIGLPQNAIVEGSIKEMEIVSSAIKNLFKHLKIKNRNVASSISGYSVIVKKISISQRSDAELEATIPDEAAAKGEKGDKEGEKEDTMDIMLVAAKKDIVEDYVSLLQLSNLNPAVLDVDAFALQNAFEISSEETSGSYAIVNVGAEELGINAIKEGVSIFTRDSSYGGSQMQPWRRSLPLWYRAGSKK